MGRRKELQNKTLVLTNSEDQLSEKWDTSFKAVRRSIERVLEPGNKPHRDLSALETNRFGGCISAPSYFQYNELIVLKKSNDLLALPVTSVPMVEALLACCLLHFLHY